MFSSLLFTMWFGFGQTFAKNYGTYESGVLGKPTTLEGCPPHIYNETTTLAPETMFTNLTSTMAPETDEYIFPHLDIYNVSYMWFRHVYVFWLSMKFVLRICCDLTIFFKYSLLLATFSCFL